MSNEWPLVSVVIPHYENEDTISQAVESVLEQSYEPVEVVLVDGSGTVEHLAEDNEQVKYYFEEPSGVSTALNRGINEADGDVISFLGADDFLRRDRLDIQVPLIHNDEYDIVYSDEYLVKGENVERLTSRTLSTDMGQHIDFFRGWGGFAVATVLLRANCLESEGFDTNLDANEDLHLWVRLLRDHRAVRVDEALAYKRILEDSLTSDISMVHENGVRAVENLVDRFPELEQYRDDALSTVHYRRAKNYLQNGDERECRRALLRSATHDLNLKLAFVFLLTVLPISTDRKNNIFDFVARIYSTT